MIQDVLGFALVAGLLTLVPGLDTALVLRTAVSRSRREAFATVLGINTGVLTWGVAASIGVASLLTASELAYTVLKTAGAAYLVGLGATLVWRAWRRGGPALEGDAAPSGLPEDRGGGLGRAWTRGAANNLLNPKVGVFYVAVLPQFIPAHAPHLAVGVLLATVHNVEGFIWLSLLILGVQAVRRWVASPTFRRVVDSVTGAVLIGFGVTLALSRR